MMRKVLPSLALLVLAGCASTPSIQYFTLNMTPAGTPGGVNIVVDDLRVSEAVTRKDIMIKTSPTEVEYYATAQWVASLSELVAEKLQAEFGPAAGEGPVLLLSGRLLAFEQVDVNGGAQAHLKLAVTLADSGASRSEPPLLEKAYVVREPADAAAPGAVVRALSACVEQAAARIQADAAAL